VETPVSPRGENDSGDGGKAPAADAAFAQRASALAESAGGALQSSSPERGADPSTGAVPLQQGLERSAAVGAQVSGADTPGTQAAAVVNANSQSAPPADGLPLEAPPPESIREAAALLAATVQPSSAEPPAAESVRVFVQGSAVAIVLRDAGISDRDAVSCAFETARQLTGLHSSLQQLTLNGRTLYQRQIDSGMRESPPHGALVFAC